MAIHDNNQAFTYDLKDQLIGAQGDAYGSFEWEYDALGNRTQEVHGDTTIAYSYGTGNNRLVSEAFGDTVNSYSYDYAGSMTRKDYYYEQSLLGGSTYNNNDDSRLTSVAQSGVVENNYYDHLGQRVLKDDAGAHTVYVYDIFGNLIGEYIPGTDAVREWIYLGSHRLAMLHANMSVGLNPPECGGLPEPPGGCSRMIPEEGEQSSAPFNWVLIGLCPTVAWGGYKYRKRKRVLVCIVLGATGIMTFMLTRKAKPQENPSEAVYYYHNDHLGTPKVLTDGDGDVVWEAVYEPFGKISSTLVATVDNPFRFPGQYDDEWTGMYYNHNRYYISGLGRYSKKDPMHYMYTYNYALENPLILIDPYGLAPCSQADINSDLNHMDLSYDDFLNIKRTEIGSSLLQSLLYLYDSSRAQVCGDLAGDLETRFLNEHYPCCYSKLVFRVLYKWGIFNSLVEIHCKGCDESKMQRRYDPYSDLMFGFKF